MAALDRSNFPACIAERLESEILSPEDCCLSDDNTLICGKYGSSDLFYAHLTVGITTIMHAIHAIPMWASACHVNSSDCNYFIGLIIGSAAGFGLQALLFPFTFLKGANFRMVREVYTYTQIWIGGIAGWGGTLFNIAWFIIQEVTT